MPTQVLEGLGYVGLKVVSNWYGHWSVGADEGSTEHAFFWVRVTPRPQPAMCARCLGSVPARLFKVQPTQLRMTSGTKLRAIATGRWV